MSRELNKREQQLIKYPPTETTWRCVCGMISAGRYDNCLYCRKPRTDDLIWPEYQRALEKHRKLESKTTKEKTPTVNKRKIKRKSV